MLGISIWKFQKFSHDRNDKLKYKFITNISLLDTKITADPAT